jgi:hypothetical protein
VNPSTVALIFGLGYLGFGIFGLLPSLLTAPPADAPEMTVTTLYGQFLGLFPVNIVHDAGHIVIGLWGLAAWAGATSAMRYTRAMAVLFAALAVMGLIPGLDTLFGVMPLYGNNVWLNALTAAVAGYAGFRASASERRQNIGDRRHALMPVAFERRHNAGDRRLYA